MLSVAHNIVVEGDLMVKMFLERLLCLFLVCRYARYVNSSVNDNAETCSVNDSATVQSKRIG